MGDLNIENACSTSANKPIGTTALDAASCNLASLDRAVNSSEPTWTSRTGIVRDTLQGALNKLGVLYDDPIRDWAPSLVVGDLRAHRYPASTGDIYIPVAPLPFTTGASFNADNWVLLSGLTSNDLINDLSQAYEFETVAGMIASTIVFPIGKRLKTKVHNTVSGKGGATYTVTSGVAPNIGSHALTTGLYARLNNGNTLNVMQWGAIGNKITDDHPSIQAAEDFARPLKRKVWFPEPSVSYRINSPLIGGTFTNWEGEGRNLFIDKHGNTTSGLPNRIAPERPAVSDVMDVDAILIIDHADNAFAAHVEIKNIYFRSSTTNATPVEYGIYNPRTFFYNTDGVTVDGCDNGFFSYVAFQTTFKNPYAVNCTTAGYKWSDDGTGGGTGTSVVFTRPYSQNCGRGYDIFGLVYSHIDTPSCDNASDICYLLSSCNGVTITSLGMEVQSSGTHGILISGGRVTINGIDDRDTSPSITKLELNAGARAIINTARFTDYTTPASAFNLVVSGGSHLISNNFRLATNGNSFTSYGGGSTRVDTNDGVITFFDSSGNQAVNQELASQIPRFRAFGQSIASGATIDTGLGRRAENVNVNITSGATDSTPSVWALPTETDSSGLIRIRYFDRITGAADNGTYNVDILAY